MIENYYAIQKNDLERRIVEANEYYLDALAAVDDAKATLRIARKLMLKRKREYEAAKSANVASELPPT